DGALDLLKELKSFNMTLKLLQETRIGMSVNGIRKHCTDEEVITLAKFLIKDWKRLLVSCVNPRKLDLNQDSDTDRKPSDSTRKEKVDEYKPKKNHSIEIPIALPLNEFHPAPTKQEKTHEEVKIQREHRQQETDHKRPKHSLESQGEKVRPDEKRERCLEEHRVMKKEEEKRSRHPEVSKTHSSLDDMRKSDVPKTPTTPTSPLSPGFGTSGGPLSPHLSTGDSVRDKCIEMIAAALRTDNDYKEFGVNCDSMAYSSLTGFAHIYQDIKATDMKYKNRVRSRISNLKDPKNPGLRKNVLAGNIELSRIATMTAEEMASDELKQLRNVLTQEAIREHQMAKTGGTTTDLLQCGKCKKKNCTYNQ
ncbi:hypothetical protein NL108_001200, partial [Boleophthalmus pectinirostris]